MKLRNWSLSVQDRISLEVNKYGPRSSLKFGKRFAGNTSFCLHSLLLSLLMNSDMLQLKLTWVRSDNLRDK